MKIPNLTNNTVNLLDIITYLYLSIFGFIFVILTITVIKRKLFNKSYQDQSLLIKNNSNTLLDWFVAILKALPTFLIINLILLIFLDLTINHALIFSVPLLILETIYLATKNIQPNLDTEESKAEEKIDDNNMI